MSDFVQSSGRGKPREKLYKDPNLQIIFAVTLTAVMGVATITPAFPKIVKKLGISSSQIGLLITVFTLPGIFLTPILGALADRLGRKRILVPSLLLFGVAGFACAFMKNFYLLLVFRFFQGVGASALGSLNVTIIGDLYSGKERISAMGYNASVLSIGTATYPALGGALAYLGWRYPFFLFFLGVPVGLLVLFFLKNPEPRSEQRFKDYLRGAWQGIKNKKVLGLFSAGVMTFIILYGAMLTYLPILLDFEFNAPAHFIGIIISCSSVSSALTSSQLGKIAKYLSEPTLIRLAFFLYALVMILNLVMPGMWWFLLPSFIFGIAQGINMPSISALLAGLAPMEHRAIFMSLNGMLIRLGQTLGPVIMAGFFAIAGLGAVYLAGTGLSLIMFVLIAFLIR